MCPKHTKYYPIRSCAGFMMRDERMQPYSTKDAKRMDMLILSMRSDSFLAVAAAVGTCTTKRQKVLTRCTTQKYH